MQYSNTPKLQHSNHFREDVMKPFTKGLDTETQLLVAIGSAVASGCISCLESITAMARSEGIGEKKMRTAAIIGQFVKDQPASHMKAKADELLGTHLQAASVQVECPMESKGTPAVAEVESSEPRKACGCS
jgi:AhpD family alkylhydroperoxidase